MRVDLEKSVAIYPILYAGCIAGVFLVSSTQYNHFLSQARTSLMQKYADLLALAFEPEDFYTPDEIALHVMPDQHDQKQYFVKFRRMVADTMIDAASKNQPANNIEADKVVWEKLEEELLQFAAQQNRP